MIRIDRALRAGTLALLATSWSEAALAQLPQLVRAHTIGCAACEGVTQFYSIADLGLGEHGRLYVLDQAPPFVRVFTLAGETVTAFAAEGRGPGEFRTPSALGLLERGGLEVVDVLGRRRTLLDANGIETGSRPFRMFPVASSRAGPAGPTYAAVTDFRTPTLAIEVWTQDGDARELLRFGADFPREREGQPSTYVALAASPSGRFAIADGATEYRIGVFDREGRRLHDLVRDVPRAQRSAQEMEIEEQRRQRAQSRANAFRQIESRGAAPRALPPVSAEKRHFLNTALRYDPGGRLWVRTERGGLAETVFDVFDGGGRWLGEVRVDVRIGRYVVGRDVLVGVTFDEDEAQYVSVFRLSR